MGYKTLLFHLEGAECGFQ